jgi:hypothetical protein
MTDMEVDEVNKMLTWAAIQLAESKLIEKELAWEGPAVF